MSTSFFDNGKYRNLIGRQARVELEHSAHFVVDHLLVICGGKKSKPRPGGTGGWFDDVWHIPFATAGVDVLDTRAAVLGVLRQVVVATVGNTFELAPAPGELELDVGRAGRVVRQVRLRCGLASSAGTRRCRDRRTTGSARCASTRTTSRRPRAERRTPSPSARTRACGRRSCGE